MSWYSGCSSITSIATDSMPTSGSPARYLRHVSKNRSRTSSRVGLNIPRFTPEFAQIANQAPRARRLAREAYIAAMQDQPVVGVFQKLGRGELQQLLLHFKNVFAGSNAGA